MKRETLLFEKGGPGNTEATLEAVRQRAEELGVKQVVLATSTGETALKALDVFEGTDVDIISVTLHAGLWEVYTAPDPDKMAKAQAGGVKFLTATHTLMGNVESAIRDKFGGMPPTELIAHTYYTFSQGMKVAVEVAVMAADAGLIRGNQEVIAVGGTGEGADTAIVLTPAYSTRFFEVKVHEVLAMPR
ncbi:MAG: hypothetical protein KAX44_09145 [Candidatus Brocadiae bacterium]|nr:hypothetical protein [Candidatus Brocadiia bacterium]